MLISRGSLNNFFSLVWGSLILAWSGCDQPTTKVDLKSSDSSSIDTQRVETFTLQTHLGFKEGPSLGLLPTIDNFELSIVDCISQYAASETISGDSGALNLLLKDTGCKATLDAFTIEGIRHVKSGSPTFAEDSVVNFVVDGGSDQIYRIRVNTQLPATPLVGTESIAFRISSIVKDNSSTTYINNNASSSVSIPQEDLLPFSLSVAKIASVASGTGIADIDFAFECTSGISGNLCDSIDMTSSLEYAITSTEPATFAAAAALFPGSSSTTVVAQGATPSGIANATALVNGGFKTATVSSGVDISTLNAMYLVIVDGTGIDTRYTSYKFNFSTFTGGGGGDNPPEVVPIDDLSTPDDDQLSENVYVFDVETALTCSSSLSATSTNQTLLPNGNISFSGTEPKCSMSLSPAIGQSGSVDVTVTVTDGNSQTDQSTFSLTVQSVPDDPRLPAIGNVSRDEEVNFTLDINDSKTGNDTDTDGETITYSCEFDTTVDGDVSGGSDCSNVTDLNFNTSTGVFNWTPTDNQGGVVYEFLITATDTTSAYDTEIFTITVNDTVAGSSPVTSRRIATDAECTALEKGRVVQNGVDLNSNGVLDAPAELTSEDVYCYDFVFTQLITASSLSSNDTHSVFNNGKFFFYGRTASSGSNFELGISDGTLGGTFFVEINHSAGSYPNQFAALGSKVYFSANDGGGNALWESDGTALGTVKVANQSDYTDFSLLKTVGNKILMRARNTVTDLGRELYSIDNTGTIALVKDTQPGSGWGQPNYLTVVGDKLYFSADDGTNGVEPWVSDGTEAGTFLLSNINPSGPSNALDYVGTDSYVFFEADDGNYKKLYSSNGTGVTLVHDFGSAYNDLYSGNAATVGDLLYFKGKSVTDDSELWVTNATGDGASELKDINNNTSSSSHPFGMTHFDGKVFFRGNDGSVGQELWVSDGTEQGTVLLKDINVSSPTASSSLNYFNATDDLLYFRAYDGTSHELWATDGTSDGTFKVKDALTFPTYIKTDGTSLYLLFNNVLYHMSLTETFSHTINH